MKEKKNTKLVMVDCVQIIFARCFYCKDEHIRKFAITYNLQNHLIIFSKYSTNVEEYSAFMSFTKGIKIKDSREARMYVVMKIHWKGNKCWMS